MTSLIKTASPRSLIPKPLTVYTVVKTAGKGAYGDVYEVISNSSGKKYVCKTVNQIFRSKWTGMSILRELVFGRVLNHPNIMQIHEILLPKNINSFQGVNIIYEKMDLDLLTLIKNNYPQNIRDAKIIMKQILSGVKYLHSVGIIHRDIKLDNILINYPNLSVKICDFGLSCLQRTNGSLTGQVVTRYYRAPEIILDCEYDESADMWSVGCILTELLIKRILLNGKSDIHQLIKIIEVIGKPDDLSYITNKEAKRRVECVNVSDKSSQLNEILNSFGDDFTSLIKGLLQWNRKRRFTAAEALNHPFFKDIEDECNVDDSYYKNVKRVEFQFDEHNLTEDEISKEVVNEIFYYHPQN